MNEKNLVRQVMVTDWAGKQYSVMVTRADKTTRKYHIKKGHFVLDRLHNLGWRNLVMCSPRYGLCMAYYFNEGI